MEAYEALEARFAKINRLQEVLAVLGWDHATMMPTGGAQARSEQMAMLKGLSHELLTKPEVEEWLEDVGDGEGLDPWRCSNIREMRRRWLHANCLPSRLIEERSRKGSECEIVWRTARKEDDFERLAPHLQEVLELTREVAAIKSEALGVGLYDALLDQFEPGGSSEKLDDLFDDLAEFLPGFLEEVLDHQGRMPDPVVPPGPFPVVDQEQLAQRMMEAFGFDFDHGRLDTSHHPFCGGYPDDIRLTTFYSEGNFLRGTMAVLHETGHAMYSRGLPKEWRSQPVGRARGMGVHESQSLFLEMQVGRSRAFVRWAAPLYREVFNATSEHWSVDNLHRVKTNVERSLIRVDADEVTYPAHVILRYRLEKAMIEGDLEVVDLPQVWNDGMEELVGIRPDDDRDGCMQDIHWMDGMFGYFPTYTLGGLMAAQLFATARDDIGDIDELIEEGEFPVLMDWLGENIHSKGCLLSTEELLQEVTGSGLDAKYFKEHLRQRYLGENE